MQEKRRDTFKNWYRSTKLYRILHMTISPKNGYLLALVVITLFSLASYASYAMFTVYEERQRVFTMKAGDISLTLSSKRLDNNNSITIPANSMDIIDIELQSNSGTSVKADINYTTINNDIDIKYVADPGSIVPDENGDLSIGANETKTVTIAMYNSSATNSTITFSKDVGLANTNLVGNNTVVNLTVDNPFPINKRSNLLSYKLYNTMKSVNRIFKLEAPVQSGWNKYASELDGLYKYVDSDGNIVYWFRGNGWYNYLSFADMWWRIMGIQSNGTIKIISSIPIDYTSTEHGTTQDEYNGYNYSKLEYNRGTYSGNNGYNGSTIKSYLESWYNANIANSEGDKIAYNRYCSDYSSDPNSKGKTTYWSDWDSLYGIYNRAFINGKVGDENKWYFTPYMGCSSGSVVNAYVATLTADEYVLAGGGFNNTTNYIGYDKIWTMSPAGYGPPPSDYNTSSSKISMVYRITENGNIRQQSVHDTRGVKPVITLKSDVMCLSGPLYMSTIDGYFYNLADESDYTG